MLRNTRRKPEVHQLDDRTVPAAIASISGSVFADVNGNGTQEAAEPNLAGVPVILRATSDNTSEAVTRTGADGTFTLQNVADGSHLVVVSPTGSGPNAADVVKNVLVAGGQSVGPLTLGVQATGSVSGTAYTDVNRNGVKDAGEPTRSGLVLDLALFGSSASVLTAVTTADGSYAFSGVPDGSHRLTVHTAGLGTTPTTVSVVGGATARVVDVPVAVAAASTTTLSGYVRLSASAADAPGLPGLTVTYDKDGNGQADGVATTDAKGYFQFSGVPVGAAGGTLKVTAPGASSPAATQRAALVSGSAAASPGNDFLLAFTGRIAGSAFIDSNGDGKYAAGDATVVPPTVQVDLFNSGTVVSVPAFAQNGAYYLNGIPDGTHTVIVPVPGGYRATTANRVPAVVTNGGTATVADVALRPAGGATVAVGNGDQAGATTYTFSTASDGTLQAVQGGVTTPPGKSASTRAVTADVNGDGVDDLITASGPGGAAVVHIYDGRTGAELVANGIPVFESSFTGGLNLSAGDFLRTGRAQLVVSADVGGGPRVLVIDPTQYMAGADPARSKVLADFFGIEDSAFRGGTRTSVGDLNGDGIPDLVVAAGAGGGPRVAIFDGRTVRGGVMPARLVGDFFAYEPTLRNGVVVAVGDVDGNGKNDLIVGAGPGGAPRVTVFAGQGIAAGQGADGARLADFYVNDDATSRAGTRLTVKDLDGDGRADLIATDGGRGYVFTGPSILATYLTGATPVASTVLNPFAQAANSRGGLFVG